MTKKSEKKLIYRKPKMEEYGDISGMTMGDDKTGSDKGKYASDE